MRVVGKMRCTTINLNIHLSIQNQIEYSIGNGQLSDVTGSAVVTGKYLAKAIISDKSK